MKLKIVNKKKAVKSTFGAKRRIKLYYTLTIDKNYILYFNNQKYYYTMNFMQRQGLAQIRSHAHV